MRRRLSDQLEDEVATAGRALAEGVDPKGRGGEGEEAYTNLCLNKMDLVSEGRARELASLYPDAVTISARRDVGPLLDAIYAEISEGRERMRVLIPNDDYGAASRLYGLADIHSRRTTEEGLWMDISLPRAASAKYAAYKVP